LFPIFKTEISPSVALRHITAPADEAALIVIDETAI